MGKFCQSCNCTAETNFTRKINCQCSVPRSRERQIIYDSPYHKQLVTAETTLFGNNFAHTGDKGTAWTRLVPPLGHWFSIWGVPQDRFLTACRLLTFQPRQPLSLFCFFYFYEAPVAKQEVGFAVCSGFCAQHALLSLFFHKTTYVRTVIRACGLTSSQMKLVSRDCCQHPITPFPLSSFCAFTANSQIKNHCPRGSVLSYRTAPPCLRPVQHQCTFSVPQS